MAEQKVKDPGALAGATGAEFEAAKLQENHTAKQDDAASLSFFWDRTSNSVQPLSDLSAMVLA